MQATQEKKKKKGAQKKKKKSSEKTVIRTPSFRIVQLNDTRTCRHFISQGIKLYLTSRSSHHLLPDHPLASSHSQGNVTNVALTAQARKTPKSAHLALNHWDIHRLTPVLIGGVPTFPEAVLVVAPIVATLGRLDIAAPPIEFLFPPPEDAVEDTVEFRLR